jgi:hypothetical protein
MAACSWLPSLLAREVSTARRHNEPVAVVQSE